MNYAVIGLTLVAAIQSGLLWFVIRGLRRLDKVESRFAHFTDALTLLAETTESGFRASAQELTRVAEAAPATRAAQSRSTTSRISRAVKRGKSITQIAAEEQIAEGEVQLRMHLAGQGAVNGRRASKSMPTPPSAEAPRTDVPAPAQPRKPAPIASRQAEPAPAAIKRSRASDAAGAAATRSRLADINSVLAQSKRQKETDYAALRP